MLIWESKNLKKLRTYDWSSKSGCGHVSFQSATDDQEGDLGWKRINSTLITGCLSPFPKCIDEGCLNHFVQKILSLFAAHELLRDLDYFQGDLLRSLTVKSFLTHRDIFQQEVETILSYLKDSGLCNLSIGLASVHSLPVLVVVNFGLTLWRLFSLWVVAVWARWFNMDLVRGQFKDNYLVQALGRPFINGCRPAGLYADGRSKRFRMLTFNWCVVFPFAKDLLLI